MLCYLAEKYPEHVLGGVVDSSQDEIMKFFFSEGLEDCSYIDNPIVGLLVYPEDRYPAALEHILNDLVEPSRINTYIWEGDLHQNLFQTATDDRYYQMNGLEKTVAQWVGTLLPASPSASASSSSDASLSGAGTRGQERSSCRASSRGTGPFARRRAMYSRRRCACSSARW